ncbi:cysteine synthase A [Dolosicoccus paucivorans]|uniref:cysteine synthase n=1 Tax=Dolosicoccus paucivorans TaxID=84521 RepID=A0A2N6SMS1_9LACT|nr:cysteine synthase A [Dolosicoccus paucivorans]PMB84113.1 cysteine synthase A [Dolosicoccus paucivorans]PMC58361.1 cysteine synthase A [Dolosicoccus paucivorans]
MKVLETIGGTPLVQLQSIHPNIYVKIEKTNPMSSIKDRPAFQMIHDAIERGELKPGMKIIEPTSGNTGIALAFIGSQLGYEVVITMPETMSQERKDVIRSLGATLILTSGDKGVQGAVDKAKELVKEGGYYMPDQFNNPSNIKSHYKATGPEIYQEKSNIKGFIAGVGTGGTVSGVGKYLKEQNPSIQVWALEPAFSALITKGEAGPHKIQGIGANFIPGNYRPEFIDHVITVTDEEAIEMAKRLAKEEGLFVGISSGANVCGALKMSQQIEGPIVTVLPDTAERYYSTALFNEE